MFDFGKFNSTGNKVLRNGIDNKDFEFKNLKEFCGKTVHVDGFFFTKGRYGKQVVVVGEGVNINMPARAVDDFEAIGSDADAVNAIMAGELVLTDIQMIDAANGTTTGYTFANASKLK